MADPDFQLGSTAIRVFPPGRVAIHTHCLRAAVHNSGLLTRGARLLWWSFVVMSEETRVANVSEVD